MPNFHLTSGLISHSSESGTWTSAPSARAPPPAPLAPVFHHVKARGLQRMAGKLHAVSGGAGGEYPPGATGLSYPCKHLAGEQDRATHGALGRGAPLLGRPPLQGHGQDGAEQQQRWQQEEGCAGPGGRHGGVTCAGGEWRMSVPSLLLPWTQKSGPQHRTLFSLLRVENQSVSFSGTQHSEPPAFPSLNPGVRAPCSLFAH